jgi:hypothetical protein
MMQAAVIETLSPESLELVTGGVTGDRQSANGLRVLNPGGGTWNWFLSAKQIGSVGRTGVIDP